MASSCFKSYLGQSSVKYKNNDANPATIINSRASQNSSNVSKVASNHELHCGALRNEHSGHQSRVRVVLSCLANITILFIPSFKRVNRYTSSPHKQLSGRKSIMFGTPKSNSKREKTKRPDILTSGLFA
jgi:hypothetical protein